jgi:hypothetical protein
LGTNGAPEDEYPVKDCAGVCGGQAYMDECGICDYNSNNNNQCLDCNDEPYGNAEVDNCNECILEGEISTCVMDCSGAWGGPDHIPNSGDEAIYDKCISESAPNGICGGDNSTCTDCHGFLNGEAHTDGCGNCVGGNTGLDACTNDCAGVPGGDSLMDNCGDCVGDNTGLEACEMDCHLHNQTQLSIRESPRIPQSSSP